MSLETSNIPYVKTTSIEDKIVVSLYGSVLLTIVVGIADFIL